MLLSRWFIISRRMGLLAPLWILLLMHSVTWSFGTDAADKYKNVLDYLRLRLENFDTERKKPGNDGKVLTEGDYFKYIVRRFALSSTFRAYPYKVLDYKPGTWAGYINLKKHGRQSRYGWDLYMERMASQLEASDLVPKGEFFTQTSNHTWRALSHQYDLKELLTDQKIPDDDIRVPPGVDVLVKDIFEQMDPTKRMIRLSIIMEHFLANIYAVKMKQGAETNVAFMTRLKWRLEFVLAIVNPWLAAHPGQDKGHVLQMTMTMGEDTAAETPIKTPSPRWSDCLPCSNNVLMWTGVITLVGLSLGGYMWWNRNVTLAPVLPHWSSSTVSPGHEKVLIFLAIFIGILIVLVIAAIIMVNLNKAAKMEEAEKKKKKKKRVVQKDKKKEKRRRKPSQGQKGVAKPSTTSTTDSKVQSMTTSEAKAAKTSGWIPKTGEKKKKPKVVISQKPKSPKRPPTTK